MSQTTQVTQRDRLTSPSVRELANQAFSRAAGAPLIVALLLQAAVIYIPFLQQAFSTAGSAGDWLRCAAVASSVLWLRQASKLITRASAVK